MNKKQKNRKLVKQNKRNRIINRRYSSTIKTLLKLYTLKLKSKNSGSSSDQDLQEISKMQNSLYSIIDKAIKKKVIHKNTAARKKSRIARLCSK